MFGVTHQWREPRPPPPRSGFVGMGGLACLLFLDLGTVRLVPWWVTTALVLVWLVLFAVAVRWFVPHPQRLPWLVGLGVAVWALAVPVAGSAGLWS